MSEGRDENGRAVINLNELEDGAAPVGTGHQVVHNSETLERYTTARSFTPAAYLNDTGRDARGESMVPKSRIFFCRGLKDDIWRRGKYYISDYLDGKYRCQ